MKVRNKQQGEKIVVGQFRMHEQTWVKVNIVVDKGIKGIIEALSTFPELEIIESCEGSNTQNAWVCFRYGRYWEHEWRDLVAFVFQVSIYS